MINSRYLLMLSLLFTLPTFAQPTPSITTPTSIVKKTFTCPPINALKRNPQKLTWSAPGGWQSYSISFDQKIVTFLGAQWRGQVVGQLTCLYRGDAEKTFPVLLVATAIVEEPTVDAWSKNLDGYRNCISRKQADCPFVVRLGTKHQDIYKEALDLKKP